MRNLRKEKEKKGKTRKNAQWSMLALPVKIDYGKDDKKDMNT